MAHFPSRRRSIAPRATSSLLLSSVLFVGCDAGTTRAVDPAESPPTQVERQVTNSGDLGADMTRDHRVGGDETDEIFRGGRARD